MVIVELIDMQRPVQCAQRRTRTEQYALLDGRQQWPTAPHF
jgi:hypothetical protein